MASPRASCRFVGCACSEPSTPDVHLKIKGRQRAEVSVYRRWGFCPRIPQKSAEAGDVPEGGETVAASKHWCAFGGSGEMGFLEAWLCMHWDTAAVVERHNSSPRMGRKRSRMPGVCVVLRGSPTRKKDEGAWVASIFSSPLPLLCKPSPHRPVFLCEEDLDNQKTVWLTLRIHVNPKRNG